MGPDADDVGDADDVAQGEQKRTRAKSNTPMFLRNCVPHSAQKKGCRGSPPPAPQFWGGVRGGVAGKEARSISYVQRAVCRRRVWTNQTSPLPADSLVIIQILG